MYVNSCKTVVTDVCNTTAEYTLIYTQTNVLYP